MTSPSVEVPTTTGGEQRQYRIVVPFAGEWLTANNVKANWQAQGRRVKVVREIAYVATCAVRPKLPTRLQLVRLDVLYRWAKIRTTRGGEP